MIIGRLQNVLKQIYHRFIKLKEEPRQIALGFSLRMLIGMTPFFGVHILSALVIASFLGWSKISALIGVNITNVLTIPIIYPLNYWVGATVIGTSQPFKWPDSEGATAIYELIKQSPMVLMNLFVGGLVLCIPLAVGGYFFAMRAVCLYRSKRKNKPPKDLDGCLKSLDRHEL
jgi:uncharacterized protein